ncbi:hypothetical protein EV715DRAFT_269385 [Schizophyllum commune]
MSGAMQPHYALLTLRDAFVVEQTWEICKVLALFIKSDLLCSICPAVLLAPGLAELTSLLSLFIGLIWVTLHLLECVIVGVVEDRLVKPNRPIASGRITVESAVLVHRGTVVALLCFSARQHTLPLSIVYVMGTTGYNDGHLSRFWALKSIMTGFGIAMCSWGAAVCFSNPRVSNSPAMLNAYRSMPKTSVIASGTSPSGAKRSLSYYRPRLLDGRWAFQPSRVLTGELSDGSSKILLTKV